MTIDIERAAKEVDLRLDEYALWEKVYDNAVAEVASKEKPNWGLNARYLNARIRLARLERQYREADLFRQIRDGLREREIIERTRPLIVGHSPRDRLVEPMDPTGLLW